MRPERPLLRLTPRARGRRWQFYIVAPVVLIVVGPFILAYKLFLGWWLTPVLNRHLEKKLREQVRTDLAFLFQNFDGRFVANDRTYKNETVVTVDAADLRIRVGRHHGDFGISVAKRNSPESRESLASILEVIYEKEGSLRKPLFVNLAELGELFREKFNQIQTAVAGENYSDTVAAIDANHQLGMQRMARAFNRPDGFFEADIASPSNLRKMPPE